MSTNGSGFKVLVIDDSNTIRRSAEIFLKQGGHEVLLAEDGYDALSKVNDHKPQLIFCDILMPRLDGYQTCLLVKQDVLSRFLELVDHFIVDIKYFDGAEHRRVLGEGNELILANYRYLVEKGADVLVRTPLIPGYTATEANIRAIARFVRLTDANARYELLNFNPLCRSKYAALEEDYPVSGQPFSAVEMEAFYAILREEGIANIVRE